MHLLSYIDLVASVYIPWQGAPFLLGESEAVWGAENSEQMESYGEGDNVGDQEGSQQSSGIACIFDHLDDESELTISIIAVTGLCQALHLVHS